VRFTADTASATGKSERAIQRDAERGEKVCEAALNMVRGTALDTGAYLDKLKRVAPDEQVETVQRDQAAARQRAEAPRLPPTEARPEPPPVTFDELRAALELLVRLGPADYLRLCPRNKRAAMCQRLSRLSDVFSKVMEDATA
jgi:hypothetical protein